MASTAIVGRTEWQWDYSRGAWLHIQQDGREKVVVDDGVNVIEALGGTDGKETNFFVGDLVWSNKNGILTTKTVRGWRLTVAETPDGFVVKAFGYGTDTMHFPKSSLHDALYDAALWADTLWSRTLRDAEGRIWQWDDYEYWAYTLRIEGVKFEIRYEDGFWCVKEGNKHWLVKYNNPIQAINGINQKIKERVE